MLRKPIDKCAKVWYNIYRKKQERNRERTKQKQPKERGNYNGYQRKQDEYQKQDSE